MLCCAPVERAGHADAAADQGHRAEPDRAADATPAPAGTGTTAAPAPAPAATPLQGTLPIVTDQFATVTVVPREEIQRSPGCTLGDVLFSKPGITGSSFAPGAASRPIIRGLDVNRVGIVDNGVGGGGVSDLGEDHFVPVDPLATGQIEVIRGPATLRYGSQSIGGVVSSTNNRIPDALPCGPFSPLRRCPASQGAAAGCDRAAPRSSCAARCRASTTAAKAACCSTPATAISPSTPTPSAAGPTTTACRAIPIWSRPIRRSCRSRRSPAASTAGSRTRGRGRTRQSVGGSYLFHGGFAGVAYTRNNNLYAIPGRRRRRPRHPHRRPPGQGDRQGRVSAVGVGAIDAIRFWWGYTDYKHNEIGFADAADPGTDGIRQTFTNKELEGRVEVQLAPFNLRFAELTTAVGVQGGHQELTAPGDDPSSPLNGLFDPNKNTPGGRLHLQRVQVQRHDQGADRRPHRAGQLERHDAGVPRRDRCSTSRRPGERRAGDRAICSFTPKSASVGLIQNLPWDLVGSVTAQYVERAPKPAELFSRGAHDATATFDIGNPDLKTEVAKSVEVGLRRAQGTVPVRGDRLLHPLRRLHLPAADRQHLRRDDRASIRRPARWSCSQAIYSQRDAIFRGGEFQFQWDVLPMWGGFWGVDGQYDIVRATFTDGTNVPRIPPQRLGGGVYFRNAEWFARVSLLHAFAQNDIAIVGETPTAGYNLLKVELSHTRDAEERSERHQADHGRRGRQQPAQRGHPQPRLLHQGRGADAGRQRAGVRQREILTCPNRRALMRVGRRTARTDYRSLKHTPFADADAGAQFFARRGSPRPRRRRVQSAATMR